MNKSNRISKPNQKMQKKFLQYSETSTIVEWTLCEILHDINRDHSNEWTDYDETDWQEGLAEWTEWTIIQPKPS